MNPFRLFHRGAALGLLLGIVFANACAAAELLPPGFRPAPPQVHALTGGRVVVRPGEELNPATILIRDGRIEGVGRDLSIPPDARIRDMRGRTIYAGFIEPYLAPGSTNTPVTTTDTQPVFVSFSSGLTSGGGRFFGAPGVQDDMGNPGPGHGIARITPEFRAVERYSPSETISRPLRETGFTAALIVPARGIVRGASALVSLTDDNPNRAVIRSDVFQHVAFETRGNEGSVYPASLMGVIAAVRQSFFDAQHYAIDHADYRNRPRARSRPEFNAALEALNAAIERRMAVMFEPGSALMNERAAQLARELGLNFAIVGSGQEWRRPDVARGANAEFIVPLDFPELPKLPADDDWDQITLDQLRAWDWAAENPALLRREGVVIALTTYGLSDKRSFQRNLRLAIDRGLTEGDALAALTLIPARLCGVEHLLGTIEPGKLANLTVVDGGSYFDPNGKVEAVWIEGIHYPRVPDPSPASAEGRTPALSAPREGTATPAQEEPERQPQPPSVAVTEPAPEPRATNAAPDGTVADSTDARRNSARELQRQRVARSPLEGRGPIASPSRLVIRNATLWTSGPEGVLTNADLWISQGRIVSVGTRETRQPAIDGETLEIDGTGLHVTPGIIDCHSHTAILGNVNESTLPSTAMVRISDVINSETRNLYEQLAGGVTTINLLHGSANAIGGQNCVIKLRDGGAPGELLFTNAPSGIKFALGENVKQSNWGERFNTRFPQSRMGVRTFYENRFTAAQQYRRAWEQYRSTGTPPGNAGPPRRDLEMEALVEILEGKRLIHCHSYRQDEILMFLRTMERFGVRVASLQHVLEGYKVADEIAAHGAGASAFSDWWAVKFELYDAIPFNGSLMRERGVVVSFNSDSSDLARRLHMEAAKAVKYGGTTETEALKFITLNPAIQLGIERWVGSLEPGKDADFAIWTHAPLDSRTLCLETWVDGKKFFDRALSMDRAGRLSREREELIAKARRVARAPGAGTGSAGGTEAGERFFRLSRETEFEGMDRDCLGDSHHH